VGRPLWREDGSVFVYAAGPCQGSLSRVRVPWYTWPYFTVSDLRLTFSLPPTTRRVTVEVFDPTSTRVCPWFRDCNCITYWVYDTTRITQKTPRPTVLTLLRTYCSGYVFTKPLPSNDRLFCLHYSGLLGGTTKRKQANIDYLIGLKAFSHLLRVTGTLQRRDYFNTNYAEQEGFYWRGGGIM
jgi:hypothetical protein